MAELLIFILEIIGAFSFAISGAITAIEKKLDYFGIIFLALVTAVGGGLLRDLTLGAAPPAMFVDPTYCIVALIAACFTIIFHIINKKRPAKSEFIKNVHFTSIVFDAIGLGVFTVVGVNTSIIAGFGDNAFFSVFVGFLTGTGGGVLRDIIANRAPVLLRREIYAVPSVIGAFIYFYTYHALGNMVAFYICAFLIVLARMITYVMNTHLPLVSNRPNRYK